MYIVMVSTECARVAANGGLADVVFGLSRELELRGHRVEIILPKYDVLRYDQIWGLSLDYSQLWVPWYGGAIECSVWSGSVHGRKCYFIEPHSADNFFNRGTLYGCWDDPMRFAFFSKAALEFMLKANKRPDVIHCHDWHTGLLPVLLFEIYKYAGMPNQRVCYTVHNFRHQGTSGPEVLWATGLGRPEYFIQPDRLADPVNPSRINFLKGGIVYSNFVVTVSDRYAWEVRHTELGCGLGHTLYLHRNKFGGIRNGIDYDVWNPETDALIPYRYGPNNIQDKYLNKEALRDRLWLRKDFKPIVAYVGRLDVQKGAHLIRHSIFYSLAHGAQFVCLGLPSDSTFGESFYRLKQQLNDNPDCHIELGFDEGLAHLIYAGVDIIVVPSNFEPCGLVQMIALKYGTVPVVRGVGGLADTVFDRDYSDRPMHERNGYVFYHGDERGLESALSRALGLWFYYPAEFRELILNGMRCDYSWKIPAQHYLNVYEYIRHK